MHIAHRRDHQRVGVGDIGIDHRRGIGQRHRGDITVDRFRIGGGIARQRRPAIEGHIGQHGGNQPRAQVGEGNVLGHGDSIAAATPA